MRLLGLIMALISVGLTAEVENITITDSSITVEYRSRSTTFYAMVGCDPCSPPDAVWKDVYKVKNGKIVKDTTINAEVKRNKSETIIWPDEK